jgi:hypothetical protein
MSPLVNILSHSSEDENPKPTFLLVMMKQAEYINENK